MQQVSKENNIDLGPPSLTSPYQHLLEVPGKGVRSKLIQAFNVWLKVDESKIKEINEVIDILHTSSLLIDDIEDNSRLRRGIPVAHLIYGVPSTINCANYMYFIALQKCSHLGNPLCTQIFAEELLSLHTGQGWDIYWRDNNECPTVEQYKKMVTQKTGGLFRLAVRLLQVFSENKTDFIPLVNDLGTLFQIRDDFINLKSEAYMTNKSFCEDLTEGKFSFPIIHSIRSTPDDVRLLKILKQKTEDIELKKYALGIMEKTGSFIYTKTIMEEYTNKVLNEVARLNGNKFLEAIVNGLSKDM